MGVSGLELPPLVLVAPVGFDGGMLVIGAEEGWLPHRVLPSGIGPWTIRLPGGGHEIQVRDPEGEPMGDRVAFIDGAPAGSLRSRRLSEGAHRVVVAAPGYRAKDRRIVLAGGGTRKLVVRLPRPRGCGAGGPSGHTATSVSQCALLSAFKTMIYAPPSAPPGRRNSADGGVGVAWRGS